MKKKLIALAVAVHSRPRWLHPLRGRTSRFLVGYKLNTASLIFPARAAKDRSR